jgi:hypothetical protein
MSAGQMMGGGIGFLLGWMMGNPMMGFSIGGMLGQWIWPYVPSTPALGDLGINSYVRDMPVPVCFGKDKVYGGVIWLGKNWVEEANDGKTKQPIWVTVYYADFAIGLCEGPIDKFLNYYCNDKLLQDVENTNLNPDDHIELTIHHHFGTTDQTIENDVLHYQAHKYPKVIHKVIDNYTIGGDGSHGGATNTADHWYMDFGGIPNETYQEGVGYITHGGKKYQFGVLHQYQDHIVIGDPCSCSAWPTGVPNVGDPLYIEIDPDNLEQIDAKAVPWRNTAYIHLAGAIGKQNSLPSFATELLGLGIEQDGYQESNPIVALYLFLTDNRWGCGIDLSLIDGDPWTDGCSWKICKDYCDVLVDNGMGLGITEPRFRFSYTFTNNTKGYDWVKEILSTCRGFIYYSKGKLKVQIENNDEPTVFYFSDNYELAKTVGVGSTTTVIYADFSSVPINFFAGDNGRITINGAKYDLIIVAQDAVSITLGIELPIVPNEGDSFWVKKENIAKDGFQYSRKASSELNNRIRVQFINCLDGYRNDFVEVDNQYDIDTTDQLRILSVQMDGVKRKSQAARMANFLDDFNTYVQYTCTINTDIVGYLLTVGDVIGIHSNITEWGIKTFRITAMEEADDYSVKLTAMEYCSGIYNDSAAPYQITDSYELPNYYAIPDEVMQLACFEDTSTNMIYVTFQRPDSDTNPYWSGAGIYVSQDMGTSFQYECLIPRDNASVELLNDIGLTDTNIQFDLTTLYESFPASGSFWIQSSAGVEEVAYDGIDDTNGYFQNCTRGYNNSSQMVHNGGDLCVLRAKTTPGFSYSLNSQIGATLIIKAVSTTLFGIYADPSNAPTSTLQIQGYAARPNRPCLLVLNGINGNDILTDSQDAVLSWLGVTSGVNIGFGYQYGTDSFGDGANQGAYQYIVEVLSQSNNALLRTEIITDLTVTTWTYTSAMNVTDNDGIYNSDIIFNVYQQGTNQLFSMPLTLTTNQ